jgi:hypothetical protein
MSELAALILYGLATWRITHILVREEGPFRVFDSLRWLSNRVGWGEGDERRTLFDMGCMWCMSVWVALALLLLRHHRQDVADFVVAVFVLSAISIVLKGAGEMWALYVRYVSNRVPRQ